MPENGVDRVAARLSAAIERRMGLGGRDLSAQLARAGRRLPGWVRRDLSEIARAQEIAGHPKLSRQLDLAGLEAAERRVMRYLRGYDRADRRRGAVLGLLGGLAFNLLALAALMIALLAWQGLI